MNNHDNTQPSARILIPSGALGLGWDPAAMDRALAAKPDLIAIDGGSTDSGPHYLGSGTSKYSRQSTLIEWEGLLDARARAGVPLVIGTAGTCGADSAVDWLVDITREIAQKRGEALKIAVLKSGQDPMGMVDAYNHGRISPLPGAPDVSSQTFQDCTNIVALAGAEQIQAALETGADVVIAGRTTDTAIIAALPLARGCHAGAAWHGAKIGECGALCATNPQSGVILIDFDATGFTVTPMADGAKATPRTVSSHMLYENSDPFILYEPGGHLDVTEARYEALDDTRVRVEGSEWVSSDTYNVKLEGARPAGYQSLIMAIVRDPRYVENIDTWCEDIREQFTKKVNTRLGQFDYTLDLRVVGQNGALGALETRQGSPVELAVLGLLTAKTQERANELAKMLNPYLLHHPLTKEEEQPTFSFPFSPAEVDRGLIYEFCLNHILQLSDPMEGFELEVLELNA